MLDKFSGIEEILAEMGMPSSNQGQQDEPAPQSTPTSSEPDLPSGPDLPEIDPDFWEGFEEDEAQWAVPVQPKVEPTPTPVPAPEPAKPDLPDFIDPSWLPPEDPDAPRIKPGTLPQIDIFKLPPRKKSKPKPDLPDDEDIFGEPDKPSKPAEKKPEPKPSATTPDDAQKFLARQDNEQVKEALSAFKRAMADLNPKERAKAIGVAMGKFKGLLMAAPSIFAKDDVKKGMQSANALMKFLDTLINTLPKDIRDLAGREMVKQVETTKERPPQQLTSKFHKNWTKKDMSFIRRRARHIIQNTGASREEAEKLANDEWNTITKLVDDYRPPGSKGWSDKQRRNAINLFTEEVEGGSDIKETWEQVVKPFIDAGGRFDEEEIDQGTTAKPDTSMYSEKDLGKLGAELTELERLHEDLQTIPEDQREKLISNFVSLGEIAGEFYDIINNISGHPKGEVKSILKDLAEEAAATAKDIVLPLLANKEWLQDEDVEFLFKDAWWITLTITEIAERYRIDVEESKGLVSWEDVKQGNLRIQADPSRKVIETKDGSGSRVRIRDPQKARQHRKNYIKALREGGSIDAMLQAKRDYHEQLSTEEKQTAAELQRIRNWEYNNTRQHGKDWYNLLKSSSKRSPQDIAAEVKRLRKLEQESALRTMYYIKESWLDEDTIENNVINQLIQNRKRFFKSKILDWLKQGLLNVEFKKVNNKYKIKPESIKPGPHGNVTAVNLFKEYFNNIENNATLDFAAAADKLKDFKAPKYKPGQTSRKPHNVRIQDVHKIRRNRPKKISRLEAFEHLMKIAEQMDPDYLFVEHLLNNAFTSRV